MSREAIHSLHYYTEQSVITDPGDQERLFQDLPRDIPQLARIIQHLLIHPYAVEHYNVHLSPIQNEESNLRSVAHMLERIRMIDPDPLIVPREPNQRLVGNCRDHAVMFTSMLRYQGIPARTRVGFARYFGKQTDPMSYDHWIAEYWDEEEQRWVLTDPQLDDIQREAYRIDFDPLDMRFDKHFYLAGRAWELCRSGKTKSARFGFNKKLKGMPYIRRSLLHDLDALNKIELLPWDDWSDMAKKRYLTVTPEEKAELDSLAKFTMQPDESFADMRKIYDAMAHSQALRSRLRLMGLAGRFETTTAANLTPSGAELLLEQPVHDTDANSTSHTNVETLAEFTPYALPHLVESTLDTALSGASSGHPHVASDESASFGLGDIIIRGASQHNLRHVDVRIPRHRFVVITGVSGSGKSSLAFDTLYAEGQRRYVESLSSYARQFLGQMEKPKVDQISGLSPTIANEQKTVSRNPRSTVGTVTEVLDYLRVLFARTGTPHCPQCGRGVKPQSAHQITAQLANLKPGTRFQILAPIARNAKGAYVERLALAYRNGYVRARVDGIIYELDSNGDLSIDQNKRHNIELVDSVETTLKVSGGSLIVDLGNEQEILLSEQNACPDCNLSFAELTPGLFSFNSPLGMCPDCNGLGVTLRVDPELIVTKPHLSLLDEASPWYGNLRKKKGSTWTVNNLQALADHYGVDLDLPWRELPVRFRHVVLYGSGDVQIHFSYESENGQWRGESTRATNGIVYEINRLFRQTKSDYRRRYLSTFMSKQPCETCSGERLCAEARFVTLDGVRFPDVSGYTLDHTYEWVSGLQMKLTAEQLEIVEEILKELCARLQFLLSVGLHYLTLDRPAPTLSGGEGQRIRLASQLGSGLVGVLYILDEPSIGLHARDHRALLDTLIHLRNLGNTVLVVEHDEETMKAADWLIDLGPGPGILGGQLVAAGSPDDVMTDPESLTGHYLSGKAKITTPNHVQRRTPSGWLQIVNARLHNLKNLDVRIPLGLLVCVTGVSGSGKSSLISKTLYPALARTLQNAQSVPGPHDHIEGLDQLDKVINITQEPIGRTPRSNPGTYVKVFDAIRKVFATIPAAKARGYKADRFSFNAKGGRCEECHGHGQKKVEMHFLPDVWVTCKECDGRRYNRQTLEILYKEKSIADILEMDVQEALSFFAHHPAIAKILQTLHDVGLDYIKIGQSALTLSGGEAQRVKLAKELSRASTGRTLYVLDEPTTGLHFADIQRLLDVLHRLVDAGNTVLVIEHNLDVIKTADWIVDLGPDGGDAGGYVVAEGRPEEICRVAESHTARFLKASLSR
ncbi:excinuclease ABC subunit UvrA [Chloroflexi bacterium TSY]|nr:excinuclease ABC subunit UvrA [Chloroflexi bacterium TSY]